MRRLIQVAEQLLSTVVAVELEDPRSLAALQAQVQQLVEVVQLPCDLPQDVLTEVRETAGATRRLLQRLLHCDQADAETSLQTVAQHLTRVRELIEGVTASAAGAETSTRLLTPDNVLTTTISAEDLPLVREFIAEVRGGIEVAEGEILRLEANTSDRDAIHELFRVFHTIKGAANCLGLSDIGALAHATESIFDVARQSQRPASTTAVELALAAADEVSLLVNSLEAAINSGGTIGRHGGLEDLLQRLEACCEEQNQICAAPMTASASTASRPGGSPAPDDLRTETPAPRRSSGMTTVRLATDRLDRLMDVVGELVIAQSMVSRDTSAAARAEPRLARNVGQLKKLTRELQELSMSLRMVPLQGVFRKMARLVRDTARACGKEVELLLDGGDTELDRNLVEAISDPLMHMVRNALDHGIETQELRAQAGKPRTGRIELKARHLAGGVTIEVSDDGRGLDRDRIRASAAKAGLLRADQQLCDHELLRLVLHPGVSTAERVTDVSGRGVGMDVVRKNIEAIRGRIDITSTAGVGSKFTVRLPLTLAVIEGLVVRVGTERYTVPITSVQQSIRPTANQVSTVQHRGELCMVRGQPLPLFRLHELFDIVPITRDPTQAIAVVVEDQGERCCLLVDEVVGQHQMVIKPLGDEFGAVAGVGGAAILGDGSVSLILDVPGLLDLACRSEATLHREGGTRE